MYSREKAVKVINIFLKQYVQAECAIDWRTWFTEHIVAQPLRDEGHDMYVQHIQGIKDNAEVSMLKLNLYIMELTKQERENDRKMMKNRNERFKESKETERDQVEESICKSLAGYSIYKVQPVSKVDIDQNIEKRSHCRLHKQ